MTVDSGHWSMITAPVEPARLIDEGAATRCGSQDVPASVNALRCSLRTLMSRAR